MKTFTAVLYSEEDMYIAECPEVGTVSQGKTVEEAQLHCHHIDPVSQNPIESADIDNCITLCKECHKEVHKKDDCKYHELRC